MGVISKLDVINDMLGSLGETGLNTLVNAPPLASRGLNILRTVTAREQSKGWWFNTEVVSLTPTNSGEIILPEDILKIDPTDTSLDYAQRGGKLYKLRTDAGESPTQFTGPVEVRIVRLIEFDDLPASAQIFISLTAQRDFMADMDGDTFKVNELMKDRREAWVELRAEHIRAVDANLLRNPHTLAVLGSLRGNGTGLRHR